MNHHNFLFNDGVLMLRRLFTLIFVLELGIFIAVSLLNIHDQELLNAFKSEQQSITSQGLFSMIISIFPHNLMVATIEFIPVIGQIFFIISSVDTALIIAIEGSSLHTSGFFVFLSLAILPHTWLELPSYAVATSTSIYLLYLLKRRGSVLRSNITKVLFMYLFVVLELAVAGVFESTEIYFSRIYPAPDNVLYPLLLWIGAVPALYGLYRLYRKIDKNEYPRKEQLPEGVQEFQGQ